MQKSNTTLRFDAAIFDFDGTLADTLPLIALAWNHALHPILQRDFSIQDVVDRFGPTDEAMIRAELKNHDPQQTQAAVERYFAHYEDAHAVARAFDGCSELLDQLRHGGLKLGLMTGKGARTAAITLRLLNWQDAFSSVVTGDDTLRAKPDPGGILRVARELDVEPARSVYIGDLPVDIQAGRAAGMQTIAAGWSPHDEAALRDAAPDFWANVPLDVARFLLT